MTKLTSFHLRLWAGLAALAAIMVPVLLTHAQTTATLYTDGTNFGIGTTGPTQKLQVVGTISATSFSGDGSGLSGISAGGWTDGGTNVYTSTTTDNVGIGTTTPASTLTIAGNIGIGTTLPYRTIAGPNNGIISEGNVGIGTWVPSGLFHVKGVRHVIIDSGGKLGVGAVPSSLLTITTTSVFDTNSTPILVTGPNYTAIRIRGETYSAGGGALIGGDTSSGEIYLSTNLNHDLTQLNPSFASWGLHLGRNDIFTIERKAAGGSVFNALMGINAAGNLGIGTTTISSKFVVNGGVGIGTLSSSTFINTTAPNGGLIVENNVGIGTANPANQLSVYSSTTHASVGVQSTWGTASVNLIGFGGGYFNIENTGSIFRILTSGTATYPFQIETSAPTGAFYIQSSGNIGMGTEAPVGALTVMNGNVGIGTWSPRAKLEVVGSVLATSFVGDGSGLTNIAGVTPSGWTDGGTNVYTSTTTDNVGIGTTTPTAALLVENAGTQASFRVNDSVLDGTPFIINESGRIGIGTTNPGFPLHVWDAVNSVNYMTIEETDATGIAGLRVVDGSNIAKIFTYGQSHPTQPNLIEVGSLSGASNDLAFVTGNNAEQMRIRSGGNVGIGTINPVAKIVIENVNAIDSLRVNDITADPSPFVIDQSGNVGIGTSSPVNKLVVSGGVGIGTLTSSTFINTTAPSGGLLVEKNVGIGTTTPVGGLAVMNGNVGIGTWKPTQRLQVIGTVNATAFTGDGSGLTGISAGGWTDGGTNVYTTTTTDNVGIGTTTPNAATLEIVNNAVQPVLKVSSSFSGDGDYLRIDSNGNIGIGTSYPSMDVLIQKDKDGWNTMSIANHNSSNNAGAELIIDGDSDYLDFLVPSAAGGGSTISIRTATAGINFGTFAKDTMMLAGSGNVGVGTIDPQSRFVVNGGVTIGTFLTSTFITTTAPSGGLLVQNNVGIGTTTPVGALTVMNGNVGIGTWSPTQRLQVVGTVAATAFSGDGSGLTGISAGGWTDGGTNVYTSTTTDNVAIGTTTPASLLTVKGNVGIGTTTPYTTIAAPANGMIVEGNVGIGTFAAASGKLIVMGGNVGIGTTDPKTGLEFLADATTRGFTMSLFASSGVGNPIYIKRSRGTVTAPSVVSNADYIGGMVSQPRSTTTFVTSTAGMLFYVNGTPGAGSVPTDLLLFTEAAGASNPYTDTTTNKFVLSSGGNVGIGTTAPVGALTVMNGYVGIGTYSPTNLVSVRSGAALSAGTASTYPFSVSNGTFPRVLIGTDTSYGYIQTDSNKPLQLNYAGNDVFIANNGNVGIGTVVAVGGVSVMNGNMGIGTWSPRARVEVNNSFSFSSIYNNGNSGAAITIDWTRANIQRVTMTAACTFTFTAPGGVTKIVLQLVQDGTGGWTATWPAAVLWPGGTAPTLTAAGGSVDFVSCLYDGTNYYCTNSLDFQ